MRIRIDGIYNRCYIRRWNCVYIGSDYNRSKKVNMKLIYSVIENGHIIQLFEDLEGNTHTVVDFKKVVIW